ncbi:uncharacterized protein LOC129988960 isoform X2 [Argiope bruennichi]|uniref:uncharacterized protein LOC129988960 isoform X2 n=1 Tax=Argiope bruennichi TaxID=94029 RepID=UPI00249417A8|nr:uncharacterized protein LOC129988960 isoform X2 [Argiope bruennichi]
MPDLLIMEPQAASLPLDELNVPVEPQVEMLAVGIGRRLREIANIFDLNAAINQASGIVPVEPQVEMLAVGIGRRLREIANIFDLNAAINQASGIVPVEPQVEMLAVGIGRRLREIANIFDLNAAINQASGIVPVEPQVEMLAVGIGRRLREIANIFDLNAAINQASGIVPVEPQVEMLAVGIGRRLREIANIFDLNAAINQASGIGNRVQFKEHTIRVPSTCDCIQIPIVRTGALDGIVNVGWTTHDKSAKAGIHYVNSQGNISFAQSEEEKTIEVEMIEDREEKKDICFTVELFDARGTFNTVTVYIVDDSNLYAEEKYFIKNIFSCADNIPISEIVTRLVDNVVTPNTFKAALQCVCSNADSISKEFALASELFRLAVQHTPSNVLTKTL